MNPGAFILLLALLTGCAAPSPPAATPPASPAPNSGAPAPVTPAPEPTPNTPAPTPPEAPAPDPEALLVATAKEAVTAIRDRDMARLAALAHPEKGVRFSPYGHVRVGQEGDLRFDASKVASLTQDETVYHWGTFDGSGEPIDLTFAQYYQRFVYDRDFAAAPTVAVNEIVGKGNTLINLAEVYPEASFVEYHFPGTEKYAGMDWASLRLVFEEKDGKWYLVGIVHDQWTI